MQQMISFFLVFATVSVSSIQASLKILCAENVASEVTVNTTSGMVKGKHVCLSETEDVVAFFGIPYAEPPINELRFMPPVKKSRWNGTLEAFQFGKICLHPNPPDRMPKVCAQMWTSLPQEESDESEDCLTLNIFTPRVFFEKRRIHKGSVTGSYPVLFFVHGGSYRLGAGGLHPGEKLSHSGAVVVTFNYRLGIFGFLSTGDSAAPGNYALMDQIMALEWVKQNIQQFGGNPHNITVVGQSAGASAVQLLLLCNRTKDLFSAAIIMSGGALSPWAIERAPVVQAKQKAELLDCPVSPSIDMVSCLRTKNASDLLMHMWGNIFVSRWAPVVDHDLISDEPENLMRKGQIHNKPVIIGMTAEEGSVFLHDQLSARAGNEAYNVIKHTGFLNTTFVRHLLELLGYNDSRAMEAALKFYYFDIPVYHTADTVWENYAQMLNDAFFTVDIVKGLNYHAQHAIPTYFYVFDYRGQNESLPTWTGAYHGMDMNYAFGCPFASETKPVQGRDTMISDLMMKFWINFAQFGNPINPDDLTRNIQWSPYGYNNGQYYLNISDFPPQRQQHYRREPMIFWNSYIPVVATFGAEITSATCETNTIST